MQLIPGTTVDRYTIEAVLGEGGMAVVYRARHNQLGSLHAIKVLKIPAIAIQDRLLQEGRVQAQLRHPNIVSVTDVVTVQGAPGLVMEFIAGSSLDQFLHDRRLTVDQADELGRGILEGVAVAHRAGLIHRDLKPANILLGSSPAGIVPKVTDFGLAKLLDTDEGGHGATRSGMAMGTPAYMAPEQIESAKGVDQRADVFSLGAILYELVGGERPFQGKSTLAILNAVAAGHHRPIEDLVEGLPDRMTRAIRGALVVDPDARIGSCDELLNTWCGSDRETRGLGSIWDGATVEKISRVLAPIAHSGAVHSSDSETYYPATMGGEEASISGSVDPVPTEEDAGIALAPDVPVLAPPAPRSWLGIALVGGLLAVGMVGVAAVGLRSNPPAPPVQEPVPIEVAPEPEPEPQPEPEPEPEPAPLEVPQTAAGPAPSKVEAEPEPVEELPVELEPEDPDNPPLTFLSEPSGARVLLDGLEVGTTPLSGFSVPKGRHRLKLVLGDRTLEQKLNVGKRSARMYRWTVEGDRWEEL